MAHNFQNLSAIDFEELARDIIGRSLGIRFEAFGPGADGGIDGRHSRGKKKVILQAKHYLGSKFSDLKSAANNEKLKLDKIDPSRYIFVTSMSLTPNQEDELLCALHPHLKNLGDIWCKEDIEGFFKRCPDALKSHVKLWLSDAVIIEKILHSGLESYTNATEGEILKQLKLFVPNVSVDHANKILDKENSIIISGPPGVGKTTLAMMLIYQYLRSKWTFVSIRNLDEGFKKLDENKPTVFFFDDFLGRVSLDREALNRHDSALATFIKQVQYSDNAKFVLTTRAHIYEQARTVSDRLDDKKLQLSKYLLDVGVYTRKIKAEIFFNHLSESDVPSENIERLLEGDKLKTIIDHKNYNPRVIESISSSCIDVIPAESYYSFIVDALNNPELIWDKPFKSLNLACQNLLVATFFSSQWGVGLAELRVSYERLHKKISSHYGAPFSPYDFETSLKSLETGFLAIAGSRVKFVNPSLQDYMRATIKDTNFLRLLPSTSASSEWSKSLWVHTKKVLKGRDGELQQLAVEFECSITPILTEVGTPGNPSFAATYSMLAELWSNSKRASFLDGLRSLVLSNECPLDGSDFESIAQEIYWTDALYGFDDQTSEQLSRALLAKLVTILEAGIGIEELISVVSARDEYLDAAATVELDLIIDELVDDEFRQTDSVVYNYETEADLLTHEGLIEELASKTGKDGQQAMEAIGERRVAINNVRVPSPKTQNWRKQKERGESFDDNALKSMFGNLVKP